MEGIAAARGRKRVSGSSRSKRLVRDCLILAVLLSASTTLADDRPVASDDVAEQDPAPVAVRETIIVTASRREKPVFDEPATVDVVSREELLQRGKTGNFVDAFDAMAAVSVQKTAQGQGSPFIRGFTGFHNLLLIDGVRFNNSILRSGPNQYWATLDPLAVARIETVKGPGSALYGSDAVGGTANVLTPVVVLDGPPGGRIYSRFATAERAGLLRVETRGSHDGRLGYLVGASAKSYGDFRGGGDTGVVENSGYDEHGADLKLRFRPRDDRELTFLFQSFRQDDVPRTETTVFSRPFRGTRPGTELRRDHDQDRSLAYLRYRRDREGPVREVEYTLAYQSTAEERVRVRGDGRSDVSGFDVGTWSGQVQLRSPSRWGLFTYGVELARDSVDSFRTDFAADGSIRRVRVQGPVADDARYDWLGIYVQDEISLARDRLSLILGARLGAQRLDAGRVEDPRTGAPFALGDSWSSTVGSIRLLWRPDENDRWRLFGSVAQAFRAPNLSDLTAFDATSAIEIPTPGLEPERFVTFEVGVKTRGARGSFTGSYFHTLIDDQIVQSPTGRVVDGTPEVRKDNVGDGFVQGVELAGDFRPRPDLVLWGNVAWLEGEVDQFLFDDVGGAREIRAPVSRLIPLTSHWGMRYQPASASRSWWLELHGSAFAKADELALRDLTDRRRIPPGGTPGFVVVGLRGAVPLRGDRLLLTAGVENLFDEDYRIHGSGQNMPGRNLVVGIGWRW